MVLLRQLGKSMTDDQLEGQVSFTDLESFDAILNEMKRGGAKVYKVRLNPNKFFDDEIKFETMHEATKFITSVIDMYGDEVEVTIAKEEEKC